MTRISKAQAHISRRLRKALAWALVFTALAGTTFKQDDIIELQQALVARKSSETFRRGNYSNAVVDEREKPIPLPRFTQGKIVEIKVTNRSKGNQGLKIQLKKPIFDKVKNTEITHVWVFFNNQIRPPQITLWDDENTKIPARDASPGKTARTEVADVPSIPDGDGENSRTSPAAGPRVANLSNSAQNSCTDKNGYLQPAIQAQLARLNSNQTDCPTCNVRNVNANSPLKLPSFVGDKTLISTACMKSMLANGAKKFRDQFRSCESGTLEKSPAPCVTDDYAKLMAWTVSQAAACIGVPVQETFQLFSHESGNHINVKSTDTCVGPGQQCVRGMSASYLGALAAQYASGRDQECAPFSRIIHGAHKSKTLCSLIEQPENPSLNVLYSTTQHAYNKIKMGEVLDGVKGIFAPDADRKAVELALSYIAYNGGDGGAEVMLREYARRAAVNGWKVTSQEFTSDTGDKSFINYVRNKWRWNGSKKRFQVANFPGRVQSIPTVGPTGESCFASESPFHQLSPAGP